MKRLLLLLVVVASITLMKGNLMAYANDEGKEESIVMIEKDLTSGEETTEKIIISTGEDILNVEAYQPEGVAPNMAIGDDDRAPVPDMLLSLMPYSAIGRVRTTFSDGSGKLGTGFLFGPNDVETAGHVLLGNNGELPSSITFWFQNAGPLADSSGTQVFIPEEDKNNKNPDYDWGVFHINTNIGNNRGYMGWTSDVSVNTVVQVIGFDSVQNRMLLAGGQVKEIRNNTIRYNVDASDGQSGSPVVNRVLDNRMVAIHSSGIPAALLNQGNKVTPSMASVLNRYRNE